MPRHKTTRGASSSKRRKIDFWDAPDSCEGGSGQ
jgi:hypothetical protein